MNIRNSARLMMFSSLAIMTASVAQNLWIFRNMPYINEPYLFIMGRSGEFIFYLSLLIFSIKLQKISEDDCIFYNELKMQGEEGVGPFKIIKIGAIILFILIFAEQMLRFQNFSILMFKFHLAAVGMYIFSTLIQKIDIDRMVTPIVFALIVLPVFSLYFIYEALRFGFMKNPTFIAFLGADIFKYLSLIIMGTAFIQLIKTYGIVSYSAVNNSEESYYDEDYEDYDESIFDDEEY